MSTECSLRICSLRKAWDRQTREQSGHRLDSYLGDLFAAFRGSFRPGTRALLSILLMFWTRCCSDLAVEMEASCCRAIMASEVAMAFLRLAALSKSVGSSFSLFWSKLANSANLCWTAATFCLEVLGRSAEEPELSWVRRLYFLSTVITETREQVPGNQNKITNHKT